MHGKPLPKPVFEVGAAALVRMHLANGKPMPELARRIWSEYERQCDDPSAVEDWVSAASQTLAWLKDRGLPAPDQLMRHFQYFCQSFEDDGRPKKRRLLDGIFFAKNSYDPDRVAKFFKKAQIYCAAAQGGLVPLAPEGFQ